MPDEIADAIRAIASDAPLAAVLRGLLAGARRATGARRALLALTSRADDSLTVAASDGLAPPITDGEELAACRTAADLALRFNRIVTTGDAMKDDRFRGIGTHAGMEIRQLGAVPIVVRGRPAAALCFHNDTPHDVDASAFATLADIAGAAAAAIELHALRDERAEDEATGGPSPRLFHQRLNEEVDRATRHGRPLALFAMRPAGDLRVACSGLRAALGGWVARASHEPGTPLLAMLVESDRAKALARLPAGTSAGLACVPGDALDVETLLMTAQEALAHAAPGRVFDFAGPTDASAPDVAPASREGRALANLLARTFAATDLDLRTQLDLAAGWIAGACDARTAVVAALQDDGTWFEHGTAGVARDEAAEFARDREPFTVDSVAHVWLHPLPASGSARATVESLAGRIGAALRDSVRLQRHRNELRARREAVARTLEELRRKHDFSTIVGESPRILEALDVVVRAAPTDAPVLISGESGTGKELLARAVHANSPRRAEPFVVLNCAAVPPALLESELFGHVKGAFTGAMAERKGLFESADGGTLFLDEVADTTLELQAKLLRALQFGEMQAVGSDAVKRVNVRIVAASNKSIAEAVKSKQFREDLYYRINVFRVHLPPLRERPEDVGRLVEFYARQIAQRLNRAVPSVEPAVIEALRRHPFPGNVRELENIMMRAFAYATGGTITPRDLPEEVLAARATAPDVPATLDDLEEAKRAAGDRLEVAFLTSVLRASRGNVSHAAKAAGMNRTSMQKLLARHRMDADSFKERT